MSPRYDVFLSHATADKPAVEYLAHKLREAGIEPFLDKWHLIPGDPWQEALEEALDESRTCAVFLGPKGIGGWQNEEMRSALETRVSNKTFRVIPVLLPRSFEPRKEKLPRFLRRLNWVNFRTGLDDEEAFRRLVSGIRGTAPGPGEGGGGGGPVKTPRPCPYRSMAQAPEEFIPRGEYDKVLEALCPRGGAVQSGTSVGITTALRGAGGFGKTTLAQQLCQDERVRESYPDGILWTTMGEDIDANGRLSRIRDLIRWWTRKESPAFETAAAAGARLWELLSSSRVLIVIDDVWSSADVTPFHGIGNGSALLITTRDSQTLPAGSKKIEVDAMASAEAVELLRSGLPDGEEREFVSLAARLGEWPLLLKIVNRQLRELVQDEGQSVQKALSEINAALDSEGFKAFDRDDPESRHAAASRTILVSVQRLPKKERERYFQLAVFAEDVQIPISVMERFWGLGGFQVRKFFRRLHDLSLALEFDAELGTVRIHDVVRQVLIEQVGDGLPELHRHLLNTFKPASGLWSDLQVEEKYLWRNLADHLLGAERKNELKQLLTDLSFLQAKLNATDVNALIADYQAFVEEERELQLIRDALRLSAHVLARDRQQLACQLFGRLVGHQGEDIGQLLASAKSQLRLQPRPGSLAPAGGPLIRTLEGHAGGVYALAVVDGRRAVSGSFDGTLRVWDLETGEILRTLQRSSDGFYALAVVDGRRAVSGSNKGKLWVWDLETGETLRTLQRQEDGFYTLTMMDGCWAISGSVGGTLRVWDLESGEILRTLKGHRDVVSALAVVDRRWVVSGSHDNTLRVWDLETGETLRTLAGHSRGVSALAVVDSRRVVSSSYDGTLRVWDLETGETLKILESHSQRVSALALVDNRRALSGSNDGMLLVWDLETGKILQTLEGHSGEVSALAVVDSRRAISGSEDWTLQVWDLEAGETLRNLERHSDAVQALAVVDDRRAVSSSFDWTLRVWDLETGETLTTLLGPSGVVHTLSVVDGRWIVCGSGDWTLRVWDLEIGGEILKFSGWANGVAVVNGRWAVFGFALGSSKLQMWDLETGETLRILEKHSGWINAMALVDDRRALSGSGDRTIRLWDMETGETLRILEGHLHRVSALAVIDGRQALSGSRDRTIRLWDLETGETLKTLKGHSREVSALAVVDGRRAVSGSDDRTLRVWDLRTGETLAVVTLEAPITAMSVSPNSRVVMAGDQVGKVHFLDLGEPE